MTCIVSVLEKGNVYIGGDSAGVSGLSVSVRKDEKVFVNGPFIIGCTSSFRMINLLRYKLSTPKQNTSQDDVRYMCTDFVDSVRKCFADNGFGKMADKTDNIGGTFLVGYNSAIYQIDSDFQVGIPAANYAAVGCGADLALGALYATAGKKPEDRIKIALQAATEFNGGVRPPFNIVKQLKK